MDLSNTPAARGAIAAFEETEDIQVRVTRGGEIVVTTLRSGDHRGQMNIPLGLISTALEQAARRPTEPEVLMALGATLTDTLFPGRLSHVLHDALVGCQRRNQRVRIRLTFEDARLEAIPWELLFDTASEKWLSTKSDLTLVRHPAMPVLQLGGFTPPLRVLVVTASPLGYAPLSVDKEIAAMRASLAAPLEAGQVVIDELRQATRDELEDHLLENTYHVLHVIAHGQWVPGSHGSIVLCDSEGEGQALGDGALRAILDGQRELRLAFLNACDTGLGESPDEISPAPLSTLSALASLGRGEDASWRRLQVRQSRGMAMALLAGGIPAVIAMQRRVRDTRAVHFSRKFYRALAAGSPVDEAVQFARMSLLTSLLDQCPGDLTFTTPVLFLRCPRGEAFALLDPSARSRS